MAKIEDLIGQIPDERLRKAIFGEVKILKKTKRFGLVFEEHLPETVRLPLLPVREGELVALKRETGNQLWRVRTIHKGVATCERAVAGSSPATQPNNEHPVDELVVVRNFGDSIYPALVPIDRVQRGGPDKPWHMLINADNFHALQLLLYAYRGKVDVIYIDPPYNTGARDWKYNNDYVDANDPWRHSKWLSFIEKRLRMAKKLLKPDGVLVVTIDEHEVQHLGCLLSEKFPEARRQMVTIVNNAAGVSQGGFYRVEEYAFFCFFDNAEPVPGGDDLLSDENKKDDTPIWFSMIRYGGINALPSKRKGLVFPIGIDPDTNRIIGCGRTLKQRVDAKEVTGDLDKWRPNPKETVDGYPVVWPFRDNGSVSTWQLFPETLMALAKQGFVRVRKQTNGPGGNKWSISYVKRGNREKVLSGEIATTGREANSGAFILGQANRHVIPKTVWKRARHDAGKWGSRTIREILGDVSFDYAKSPYAVYDTLAAIVGNTPDALVLDFFGGSGTTFHATALLNAADNGRRQCILVTNNEVEEGQAKRLRKLGIYPGEEKFESEGICERVTWPRCKYVVQGSRDNGTKLEGKYLIKNKQGDEISLQDGFLENIEYFHLNFVDPARVARGDAFEAILPIIWMMAGGRGKREDSKGSQSWFIPKQSPFAVLIKEKEIRAFRDKLTARQGINWIFLVTDSEENFAAMRNMLGHQFQCVQLYKSYLESFHLNAQETLI
jgi:adenine-specific DNA-methyltransferase